MPWYVVQLEGRFVAPHNITPNIAGGEDPLRGFFTTRVSRGRDLTAAYAVIVDRLRHDLKQRGLPHGDGDVRFRKTEAWEHRFWKPGFWLMRGFTFYANVDDDDDSPPGAP